MALNFNCMWVLVLMLRKCITLLRMTKLCHVLPIDQHILFHKMVGRTIAVFSLVHTGAHIGNAGKSLFTLVRITNDRRGFFFSKIAI